MTYLQRSLLAISIALALLLAVLIIRSFPKKADELPVTNASASFNPDSACRMTEELASLFPERAMGTQGSKAAAQWIIEKMKEFDLCAETQEFSGWICGNPALGRNVVGIDNGASEDMIVLLAHYDIPFHVREGAMDDASGVGALLELARVFSREEQEKTLVFVASDGEEWGMLGARHFVDLQPKSKRIFAAISLDYVRVESPEKVYLGGEGQFRRYAPLWLWILAEDCVLKVKGTPKTPTPLTHYVNCAVNISSTDQGPFVTAGVPAINLGGNKSDSPLARRIYHTRMDTAENLRPELFSVFGRSAELLARSLDELDYTPPHEEYFLPLGNRLYVGRPGLLAMQMFLFLPLLLATLFQYYNSRFQPVFMSGLMLEAVNFGLFLLPCLLAVTALQVEVRHGYIPRYELYPATPLDPFLYKPLWGAIAIPASLFAGSWIVIILVRRLFPLFRTPTFAISKAIGLDILFTVSIFAFLLNGFAATLFLAPAALCWVWIEQGRGLVRMPVNLILLLVGISPFVLLLYHSADNLRLGWYVLWYLTLAIAYKFFSPAAVFIGITAATVGARLMQQSFSAKKQESRVETKKDELQGSPA